LKVASREIDSAQARGPHRDFDAGLPGIITTGVVVPAAFKSSSSDIPSLPGMTTSEKITSNRSARISSNARVALSHTVAS